LTGKINALPINHSSSPRNLVNDDGTVLNMLLESNGLSLIDLLSMSKEKQHETLLSLGSKRIDDSIEKICPNNKNLDLATALKGLLNKNDKNTKKKYFPIENSIDQTSKARDDNISERSEDIVPIINKSSNSLVINLPVSTNGEVFSVSQRKDIRKNMLQTIENKKINSIMNIIGTGDNNMDNINGIGFINQIGPKSRLLGFILHVF
jgi:hypothetical protein